MDKWIHLDDHEHHQPTGLSSDLTWVGGPMKNFLKSVGTSEVSSGFNRSFSSSYVYTTQFLNTWNTHTLCVDGHTGRGSEQYRSVRYSRKLWGRGWGGHPRSLSGGVVLNRGSNQICPGF